MTKVNEYGHMDVTITIPPEFVEQIKRHGKWTRREAGEYADVLAAKDDLEVGCVGLIRLGLKIMEQNSHFYNDAK